MFKESSNALLFLLKSACVWKILLLRYDNEGVLLPSNAVIVMYSNGDKALIIVPKSNIICKKLWLYNGIGLFN